MPRRCTVCFHEARDEIDGKLSGDSVISRLASEYSVSEQALLRHKANHLIPEMREKLAADPDLRDVDVLAEMKSLYRRMHGHLERVEETDNWQAIKAFHSEARQDLELLAKLIGQLDERPQVNIALIEHPDYQRLEDAIFRALLDHDEARWAVAENLRGLES